jgi:hypothetical protein
MSQPVSLKVLSGPSISEPRDGNPYQRYKHNLEHDREKLPSREEVMLRWPRLLTLPAHTMAEEHICVKSTTPCSSDQYTQPATVSRGPKILSTKLNSRKVVHTQSTTPRSQLDNHKPLLSLSLSSASASAPTHYPANRTYTR